MRNLRKQTRMDNGVLNSVEQDICFLIGGYLIKTKKSHQLIDQRFMLDKLESWFMNKISRSTLCYNLKNLVEAGYLKRIPRHRRNPETGKFEPRVTLYIMTMKLKAVFLRLAARMRNIGWLNHITSAKQRVREATKAAIIAAREAALPTMSGEEARRSFWENHYPQRIRT